MTGRITFILLFLISAVFLPGAYDRETVKIMPFVESNKYCKECHSDKKSEELIRDPLKSCVTYCKTCHNRIKDITEKHHVVGKRLKFQSKYDFRISGKKKIACYTCHDLGINRYDSSSWKSESFYEKVFKKKAKYKTYYLVMKNNEGQLCTRCHY